MKQEDVEFILSTIADVLPEYIDGKLEPIKARLDALEAITAGTKAKPRQRVPAGRQEGQ
jgi:hypothetical protein